MRWKHMEVIPVRGTQWNNECMFFVYVASLSFSTHSPSMCWKHTTCSPIHWSHTFSICQKGLSIASALIWEDKGYSLPPCTRWELKGVNLKPLVYPHYISLGFLFSRSSVRRLDYCNILYGINEIFSLDLCILKGLVNFVYGKDS